MTDTTNGATATTVDEWFYTQGGERKGPVPANRLRELLASQTIDGETPIWHKGLAAWKPLIDTELGEHLKDTPPPVAPALINNGLVWTLAVAPIAYLFFDSGVAVYQFNNPYQDHSLLDLMRWLVPAAVNATLCLLDERQLKKAGYASSWMTLFALLLAPVYLFMRAQRLRQTPSYGYVWIASFVVSLLLGAM